MRISLADSQTNGFKRWSDAQRPAQRRDLPDIPDSLKQDVEGIPPASIAGVQR